MTPHTTHQPQPGAYPIVEAKIARAAAHKLEGLTGFALRDPLWCFVLRKKNPIQKP